VYNYLVVFPYKLNAPLPRDSWIWYRNYTLEAYPPPVFWTSGVGMTFDYDYTLMMKDGTPIGRSVILKISLEPGKD